MRLIDADELLDNIEDMWCDDCSLCGGKCRLTELKNMISTYPTAYDVDKVVDVIDKDEEWIFDSDDCKRRIIQIIRAGGKEQE